MTGIRVIHVTTVPESLRFLSGQVRFLCSKGCNVSVVSSGGPLLEEFAQCEGVPSVAINMYRKISPSRDLVAVYRLWKHFLAERPDIVHAHTPKAGLLAMISATLARVPVRIYHIRGLPVITCSGWKRHLLTRTERISCNLAKRVFAVSNSMRDVAIQLKLCSPQHITVFGKGSGNGVDAERNYNRSNLPRDTVAIVRKQLNIPENAQVLGFVGRIVRDKGIVELAQAWQLLKAKHSNLHLMIVGYFETQDPIPSLTASQLQNDDRIHFAGTQKNTAPYYAAMDVLVLPTYREGFPNVLLEAAAMQLPAVATDIPGCTDAIVDGETGTLVTTHNSRQLADAIDQYLLSPPLQKQHGNAGRTRVLADFNPQRIWDGVWQEYVRLLKCDPTEATS